MSMKPEFKISERGTVLCKFHPKYQLYNEKLRELHNANDTDSKYKIFDEYRILWRQVKSCFNCDYFTQDECYFSNRKIKWIRSKIKLQLYRCKFCGSAIDDGFYVLSF